jgi:hypothetical protein
MITFAEYQYWSLDIGNLHARISVSLDEAKRQENVFAVAFLEQLREPLLRFERRLSLEVISER